MPSRKILTVVGNRPQFIKAAPFLAAVEHLRDVESMVVHTGQHYDANMSQVFFDEMGLPKPHFDLAVGSGGHGMQTGRMLEQLEKLMQEVEPRLVVVFGDTNTTLAGALAAAKLNIESCHIEAGLRSFNRRMPEERNRVVSDHVCEHLFAPTDTAVRNLRHEGLPDAAIHQVGDIMFDAALMFSQRAKAASSIVDRIGLEPRQYVLATVHRADNTDDPERLRCIFEALARVGATVPVVVPLHPRTRARLGAIPGLVAALEAGGACRLIDPVGYLDMIRLESDAKLIVTDSGGVQKEAFFFDVPAVILRPETEWVELVETGWSTLVAPTSIEGLVKGIEKRMDDGPGRKTSAFGDGRTGPKIAAIIDAVMGSF